jgi:hypothetical protein
VSDVDPLVFRLVRILSMKMMTVRRRCKLRARLSFTMTVLVCTCRPTCSVGQCLPWILGCLVRLPWQKCLKERSLLHV